MSDKSSSNDPDVAEELGAIHLEQESMFLHLPSELLLHICSFLEATDVLRNLARVCKQFYEELTSSAWWKARLARKWPNKVYPPIESSDGGEDWAWLCVERERAQRLWQKRDSQMQQFTLSHGIFAAVDSVHLLKEGQLLVSGSRDRYLNVWDLSRVDVDKPQSLIDSKVLSNDKAHKGWVWCLDSSGNQLVSGSWDSHIKMWDIENNFQETQDVKLKSAVLCVTLQDQHLVTGGFDSWVTNIDPRVGITSRRKSHSKPVLCMARQGDMILTGSEDNKLVWYDRRAERDLHTIKLSSYPLCVSWRGNTLWVGNKRGELTLIDTTAPQPSIVAEYPVHQGQITGLVQTTGYLATCSKDKSVCVLEPSRDPDVICSLTSERPEQVCALDLQNQVLAAAYAGGGSISIWQPRSD